MTKDIIEDNRRIRKENRRLLEENGFLKKENETLKKDLSTALEAIEIYKTELFEFQTEISNNNLAKK